MFAKDLREALENVPDDARVFVLNSSFSGHGTFREVGEGLHSSFGFQTDSDDPIQMVRIGSSPWGSLFQAPPHEDDAIDGLLIA